MSRGRLTTLCAIAMIAALLPLNAVAGAADGCGDTFTPIYDIQGDGWSSPFKDDYVTTEGVVTHDVQTSSELKGFYLQDATGDGIPATSDGIFVYKPNWKGDVSVGDHIRITAKVAEFYGETQLSAYSAGYVTCDTDVGIAPTEVLFPMTAWESVEGMLVTFPQDLYISEFYNFDRFGEIVLTTTRQYQPSQIAEPGSADAYDIAAANAANRVMIDDNRSSSNPDPAIHPNGDEFTLENTFRGGDLLQGVTGAVAYSFSNYKIEPTVAATHTPLNPRPTTPDPIRGDVRVASFNVLNFFTTIDSGVGDVCGPTGLSDCRGADTYAEYVRQLDKLVAGILALDADIVGIQEIENDVFGDDIDGSRKHDAVRTLVEALNDAEGSRVWAWVGKADHYNDYPVRNEIIYRLDAVLPIGKPIALADPAFDDVRPPFDPDDPGLETIEPVGRPPLAQTFAANFQGRNKNKATGVFTVVVNHFKSKGSSCALIEDPFDDHQANCNLTRVAQAEALMAFVAELQASTGDDDVLIIGDLNSYAMEDPIDTIREEGFTDLLQEFVGDSAYGYLFDGQLGTLDHALASISLMPQVKGATVFHINADEPDILDYDMSFKKPAQDALYEPLPYRVSDHDPVIVGLNLTG